MANEGKPSSRAHILIVEDSSVFREMQSLLFRQAGFAVSAHEHPHTALAAAKERKFHLVVIDYELPAMNGQQFMHALRRILPDIHVIFVSGSLTLELAIQLSREGVAGIFNKPANPKNLIEKINDTLHRVAPREAAQPGKGSLSPLPAARRGNSSSPFATAVAAAPAEPAAGELAFTPVHFLGQSEPFRELTHRLWKVRDFRAVLLLQGEPGSPFALIARDLAAISIFRDGPIMVCDAPEFGTARLLEVLAPSLLSHDAGTLVVTGIETFTPAQQKILQTLLASRDMFQPFARRFRVVLAAAANLSELADAGQFNDTLFYKISALSISVPPLRELRGDILANVRHILDQHAAATQAAAPFALTPAAAAWLEAQPWPGNYAQLARVLVESARPGSATIDVSALEAVHQRPELVRLAAAVEPPPTPVVPARRPAAPLTAKGLFRPAFNGYSFNQRLTEALAGAEALARA